MRLNFRWKLVATLMFMVFISAAGTGIWAVNYLDNELQTTSWDKLQSDSHLGRQLLESNLVGDWKVENGQLYRGEVNAKGVTNWLDQIKKVTGNEATIFYGDKRIATTVTNEQGERIVDTSAAAEVVGQVIGKGQEFTGIAKVNGVNFLATYEPIRVDGKVVGMWFVGSPEAKYKTVVDDLKLKLLLSLIAGLIGANILAWLISITFVNPVNELVRGMSGAKQGNFGVRVKVKSKDEFGLLGDTFNTMMDNISGLVRNVIDVCNQVSESAHQLSNGAHETGKATEQIASVIHQVALGTDSQAKSVEQTSENVGQMSELAHKIASNAQEVSGASSEANRVAADGLKLVDEAVYQMRNINVTVRGSAKQIATLGDRSQEIGKIVDVITGLAKQTNLLALNAAIEAARAGEHGRGFAVVADEVRKLAEQSAEAATQIGGLITEIQRDTLDAVKAMELGTVEVEGGTMVVDKAGAAFNEIVESIKKVYVQIQEVSHATEQLAGSGEQVVIAIENIASISEQTAASSQQVAVAAEEQTASVQEVAASATVLAEMAEDLRNTASKFKTK